MSDISEKLLERAIESILHGSTQFVETTDYNGQKTYQTVKINDLRQEIVDKLVTALVSHPKYVELLNKAFDYQVSQKLKERMLDKVSFSDLPYSVRDRLEKEMKDTKLEVKKYKLVAEVID